MVNARLPFAAVCIEHQPRRAGDMLLQDEDVTSPSRYHVRRRGCAGKLQPVRRQKQVADRPTEDFNGCPAATEGSTWATGWMGDNGGYTGLPVPARLGSGRQQANSRHRRQNETDHQTS